MQCARPPYVAVHGSGIKRPEAGDPQLPELPTPVPSFKGAMPHAPPPVNTELDLVEDASRSGTVSRGKSLGHPHMPSPPQRALRHGDMVATNKQKQHWDERLRVFWQNAGRNGTAYA